ncbi:MAG TPA: isoprenylcysteine carboxylmethyltransferase family protein [Holophagaceae bacterium]|jgi:protein-S-isoprenylcysteine O-methyltransferase Ste14|nr:isoprenylcysteine carboxylmethyltransferase family protein [Holophagaceae bacterium]
MDASAQSPGVRFPPPFYAILAVLIGWLLQRQWPLPAPEAGFRWIPGALLTSAAVLLMLAGALTLRRHRTTIRPDRAATSLVGDGPYAFTRNPLYLAMVLVTPGLGFLMAAPWVFILWPVVALILDRRVIAREERHLEAVFGETYGEYKARVRRWI